MIYSQINKYTPGRACACFSFRACPPLDPSFQGGLERYSLDEDQLPPRECPRCRHWCLFQGLLPPKVPRRKEKCLCSDRVPVIHCIVPSTLQAGGHSCGVQVSSRASMSLLKSCRKSEQCHSQHLPQCQVRAHPHLAQGSLERANKASLIPACPPPTPFRHPGHSGMLPREILRAAERLLRDVGLCVAHQQ